MTPRRAIVGRGRALGASLVDALRVRGPAVLVARARALEADARILAPGGATVECSTRRTVALGQGAFRLLDAHDRRARRADQSPGEDADHATMPPRHHCTRIPHARRFTRDVTRAPVRRVREAPPARTTAVRRTGPRRPAGCRTQEPCRRAAARCTRARSFLVQAALLRIVGHEQRAVLELVVLALLRSRRARRRNRRRTTTRTRPFRSERWRAACSTRARTSTRSRGRPAPRTSPTTPRSPRAEIQSSSCGSTPTAAWAHREHDVDTHRADRETPGTYVIARAGAQTSAPSLDE